MLHGEREYVYFIFKDILTLFILLKKNFDCTISIQRIIAYFSHYVEMKSFGTFCHHIFIDAHVISIFFRTWHKQYYFHF